MAICYNDNKNNNNNSHIKTTSVKKRKEKQLLAYKLDFNKHKLRTEIYYASIDKRNIEKPKVAVVLLILYVEDEAGD